jgi:hypothetical protein
MRAGPDLYEFAPDRWSESAEEIARIVSRRTVYTNDQIERMAETETKVMLFRLIHHFEHPVPFAELKRLRIVRGSVQSITHITDESFSRVLHAAER